MKQSYCGLCENCRIDKPDFLEAIGKVKEYIGQLPMYFLGALLSRRRRLFFR